MLEYVVEDFLEVKGSLREDRSFALRNFLSSQRIKGSYLTAVEGFYLEGHLILLDQVDPGSFRHLICVTPGDGRIRVRRLS